MGGTTNLTPDTPYSFATYSDLSAAVAANGGQSLGPAVSVAGVLWFWDGTTGEYEKVGGGATVYADFSALVAAVPSPSVGDTASIAGGGIVKYTASGWLGDIGVVSTLAEAQALTGIADGSTCTVSGDGIVYVAKA